MIDSTRYIAGLWTVLFLLAPLGAMAQLPDEPDLTPVEAPGSVLELQGNEGVFTDTGCSSDASDGNAIGCWADQSGQGNDATASSLTGPDLATGVSGLNGQDALLFDRTTNSNEGEGLGPADDDSINTASSGYAEKTIALAVRTGGDVSTRQVIYEQGDANDGFNVYVEGGSLYASAWSNTNGWGDHFSVSKSVSTNTSYVVTFVFDKDASNQLELFVDGSSAATASDGSITEMPTHSGDIGIGNVIGGTEIDGSPPTDVSGTGNEGFGGHVAELILSNEAVNSAQRQILESALGERYGVSISNDRYTHSGYVNDVTGLGQASDGTQQTTDTTSVLFFDATSLSNGDFALFGHDGEPDTLLLDKDPTDVRKRLDRVWRYEETGSPSFDLKFDVSGLPSLETGQEYQLIFESSSGNGSFADASTTVVTGTLNSDTLTVAAGDLSSAGLSGGDYLTLAISDTRPNTPSLTASVAGPQKVSLSWGAVSNDRNGDGTTLTGDEYRIYQNTGGKNRGFSNATQVGNTTTTSFDVTGLDQGRQYFFWVVAVNSTGESPEQDPAAGATPAPFGSTGPGGVGSASQKGRLNVWLRADEGVFTDTGCSSNASDGNDVGCWADQSGYGNHDFEAGTSPSLSASGINGQPALSFDGSSEWLGSTSDLTTDNDNSLSAGPDDIPETNYTQFVVFNTTDPAGSMVTVVNPVDVSGSNHDRQFGLRSAGELTSRIWDEEIIGGGSVNDGSAHVGGLRVEAGSGQEVLVDGSTVASGSKYQSDFNFEQGITIAGHTESSFDNYYGGEIAEVILYNDVLSDAEQTIVQNYLASKYGASLAMGEDKFAHGATYGTDVAGIGQGSDGSDHLASTSDLLEVSAGSFSGNDRYVFLGHDGTPSSFGYESTEPINGASANAERMEREWRVDLSGIGSKTVTVSVSESSLPSRSDAGYEYVLIVDSGDKFNTSPRAYTLEDNGNTCGDGGSGDGTCTASVALDDDDYVTIGAGTRVVNVKRTSDQGFETSGSQTALTAALNLPYPSSSGTSVSVQYEHTGDLDGTNGIEDSGSGNDNGDYEASDSDYDVDGSDSTPQTKTISAGSGTTDIPFSLQDDGSNEQTEKFEITIDGANTTNAGSGPDDRFEFSILDDDEPRDLKFADSDYTDGSDDDPGSPSTTEGDGGSTRVVDLTIKLREDGNGESAAGSSPYTTVKFNVDQQASDAVLGTNLSDPTVDFKIVDNSSGKSGGDEYQEQLSGISDSTGRVHFGSNNSSAPLKLEINEDDIDDADSETIVRNLFEPVSGALVNTSPDSASTTFVIEDDDTPPTVQFAGSNSPQTEDTDGSVDVSLSSQAGKAVTVNYSVDNNASTATEGGSDDFTAYPESGPTGPDTLQFAVGQTTRSITVDVNDDTKPELTEAVEFVDDGNNDAGSSPTTGATWSGTTSLTYKIQDNDNTTIGTSGPGGVGATDGTGDLNIWLQGVDLYSTGNPVDTWSDRSGYGHDFTHQGASNEKPTVSTINGQKVLNFATEDWLGSTASLTTDNSNSLGSGPDDIPETDYTQFLIFKTSSSGDAVTVVNPVGPSVGNNDRNFGIQGSNLANRIFDPTETVSSSSNYDDGTVHVAAVQVEKNVGQFLRADGAQIASGSSDQSGFDFEQGIVIGRYDNQFGKYSGEIGAFALYDRVLNDTRRTLVENHLASKFDVSSLGSDVYAGDQSGNGNYDRGVFGVGRESTEDFHKTAGRAGLSVSVNKGLDTDGDYLTLGHRTAANSVTTSDISGGGGLDARLERAWYTDLSNDANTSIEVNVTVDLSEAGLAGPASAGNYVLLQRNADVSAGTNWTSKATGASVSNGDEITFSNVTLENDKEITLGTRDQTGSPLGGAKIVLQGTEGNEGSVDDINPTGGDAGYAALGPPETGGTFGGLASDTDPQLIEFGLPGPMIYTYDAANSQWTEVTSGSDALPNAEGFLLYVFDDKGSSDADPVDPTLPITVSDGGGVPSSDQSVSFSSNAEQWLFVANPFAVPFDLADVSTSGGSGVKTTAQIYDRTKGSGGGYTTSDVTGSGMDPDTVGVGQGFFLECNTIDDCPTSVTLSSNGRVTGDRSVVGYKSRSEGLPERFASMGFGLTVEQGGDTVSVDRAAEVVFYEEATEGWDRYDATKLAPFASEYATLAPMSPAGDSVRRAAKGSLPWPTTSEALEVPLEVTTVGGVSGTATVRLREALQTEGWRAEVVDTKGTTDPSDDEAHLLTAGGKGYTFTLGSEKSLGGKGQGGKSLDGEDPGGQENESGKKSESRQGARSDTTGTRRAGAPGALSLTERLGETDRGRSAAALGRGAVPGGPADETGAGGDGGAEDHQTEDRQTGAHQAKASEAKAEEAPSTRLRLRITPSQSALPVELADLAARQDGEGATIQWKTASETNNAGFYVEHRRLPSDTTSAGKNASSEDSDAEDWNRLGFVEGAGTTTEPQTYRYEAEDLAYGRHAFRLRQVDTDGTETTTDRVTLDRRLKAAYAVEAPYPNPTRGEATLPVTVREAQEVTVRVYDVLGRRVRTVRAGEMSEQETRTIRVPTGDLASGQYFVRVRGESFSATKRLTVVR